MKKRKRITKAEAEKRVKRSASKLHRYVKTLEKRRTNKIDDAIGSAFIIGAALGMATKVLLDSLPQGFPISKKRVRFPVPTTPAHWARLGRK